MTFSSGARLGPYEILAPLGAGGMGEVYRALDPRLGREVAIKVLPQEFARDPQRLARFEREARVLASLNHPNIAAIYGFEQSDGVPFLVLELAPGEILRGPLAIEDTLAIARQIAEALEAAHDKGIIHRDLKPANVKVARDGKVKVLDFGLAKAFADEPAGGDPAQSPTLSLLGTRAGVILGTAAYMSPEQARGKPLDRRTDVWSFGCVLYEILSGRQAFRGDDVTDTLAAVVRAEPDWSRLPAALPAAIRELLRRCLQKDTQRRLQHIGEARVAIEEAVVGAAPVAPEIRAEARRGLKPALLMAWAVAASLAAAALAVIHFRETPPPAPVQRYSLAPPPKTSVSTFALSPDGRYLAIAATAEGKRRLWVRALDALQPQLLPGGDDADFPFWSPDSRYIGFFAQGKLRKLAATGGPPQTLCDAAQGRGGTWNRDGVIVFAPAPGSSLQRVSSAGGVPTPATRIEGVGQRFPVFLPDGRHFLYLAAGTAEDKTGVSLASLDSPAGRRLLADNSSAAFVPPGADAKVGHLLFVRENTLMAQPFDLQSLQLTGELFPVAEQVSPGSRLNLAPVSVSETGMLIYHAGRSIGEHQLTWHDRSGKVLAKAGASSRIFGFSLSPDEKTVAVTRAAAQGATDLWLHDLARGADTRFTFHPSQDQDPVWSPDGSRIVFTSTRSGRVLDLYLKDTSGAGQDELLLQSANLKLATDWSPDGRFLAYTEVNPKTRNDLWVLPMTGDRKPVAFLQTEFTETQGQFSPDGRWMAYGSDESNRFEVYVRPFPSGAGKWKVSINGGRLPLWRRDGKELFYLSPENKLMAVAVKAGAASGPRSVFETAAPQELFQTRVPGLPAGYTTRLYEVAGDGKRFLVTSTGEESGVEEPLTVVVNWLK